MKKNVEQSRSKSGFVLTRGYRSVLKPLFNEPSITVPGESYTVRELFKRFAQGTAPAVGRQGNFNDTVDFDSDDLEKIQHQDLVDLEATVKRYKENADYARAQLKKRLDDEERETKERKAAFDRFLEAEKLALDEKRREAPERLRKRTKSNEDE